MNKNQKRYPFKGLSRALFFLLILTNSFATINYEAYEEKGTLQLELQTGARVLSMAVSPDGNLIATAASEIKLWHKDGKLIRNFYGHKLLIKTLAFSPDGNYLVSGADDHTVRIWKLDGTLVKILDHTSLGGWQGDVKSLAFLDSQRFITFPNDGYIYVWNLKGEQEKKYFFQSKSKASSITDKVVLDAKMGRIIRLHKVVEIYDMNGVSLKFIQTEAKDVALNVLQKQFAVATGNYVIIYDINGNPIRSFAGHTDKIESIAYSPDGQYLISGGRDKSVRIWDMEGKCLHTIPNTHSIEALAFSPIDNQFLVGNEYGIIHQMDIKGNTLQVMGEGPASMENVAVSSDGTTFYTHVNGESIVRVWDITGSPLSRIQTNTAEYIRDMKFSRKAEVLAVATNKLIYLYDKKGTLTGKIDPKHDRIDHIAISNDGKVLVSAGYDRILKLWSIDGKLLESQKFYYEPYSFDISNDKNTITIGDGSGSAHIWKRGSAPRKIFSGYQSFRSLSSSMDGNLFVGIASESIIMFNQRGSKVWESTTATAETKKAQNYQFINCVTYSPDGKYVAIGMYNGGVKLYYASNGKLYKELKGHKGFVNDLVFHPGGKHVLSVSSDQTTRVFNIQSGKYYALASLNKDWLVFTEDGYWDGSADGGRFVAMVKGLSVWGIDQFALKNNRPDLIIKELGLGNTQLVQHYYAQYLKRLRKAGFQERDISKELHIPRAKITKATQNGKFIQIDYQLEDLKYPLKSYNIYINDVPLYGAYGQKATSKKIWGSEKIELTTGQNKIEISCINQKGSESYRDITYANYNQIEKGNLYFIGFGVSRYKDSSLNLKYADKDVEDMAEIFSRMKNQYAQIKIKTYLNEEVTPEAIQGAKKLLKDARADDTFVLFISGHGVHDTDKEGTYYYLTHNSHIKNLKKTAADYTLIEDLMQGIAPRKKLFLMDTCESGEVEESTQKGFFSMAAKKGIKARTTKGLAILKRKRKNNSVARAILQKNDRFIYNDLIRRSGAIVFSSSKGGEFSYESDALKNGFFTHALLNALKGEVEAEGLFISFKKIQEYVSKVVAGLSEGLQNPTVDRDNIFLKLEFQKLP